MSDDYREGFYVGYRSEAPPALARTVRRRVIGLLTVTAVVAIALVAAQGRFAVAFFEFGQLRVFEGFVSEHPYPTLLVERPSSAGIPFSRYLLSVPGKKGAQEALAGLDGKKVRFEGTLVYRDDQTMIEIAPDSISPATGDNAAVAGNPESLGRLRLRGEVVDSKCYLGVMKPGNLKAHRSCAIRCISGGIPPVFVARDESDNAVYLLLVGTDNRALGSEILDIVADPLEVEGEVLRDGALLILKADRDAFRLVTESP